MSDKIPGNDQFQLSFKVVTPIRNSQGDSMKMNNNE